MRDVVAGDHDPVLVGVGDALGGQGREAVVGLVELAHRGEIDVREGIAGDHQEGVAEEVGDVADATGGARAAAPRGL